MKIIPYRTKYGGGITGKGKSGGNNVCTKRRQEYYREEAKAAEITCARKGVRSSIGKDKKRRK